MFLGIDVGTGSSKAVLVDAAGKLLDSASVAHEMTMPHPGWAEFDAEAVWWAEVCQLSRSLLSRNDAAAVEGVCVSGMGPCLVVTDADFRPLRPAILYGIDTRAHHEIEVLNEQFGAEQLYREGGKMLSSQSVGPKLRWLREHEPEVFDRATHWFGLNSFIAARLTGEYVQDHHSASQCDPLYDLQTMSWSADRYEAVAEHLAVPSLVWPAEIVGQVHRQASDLTGIPVGTPVCAGTVDAWAEAFSAGVRRPGDTMLMYGSTFFFVQNLHAYQSHEKLWTTAGVDEGSLSIAAGMSTSGSLTTWMRRLFGNPSFEQLLDEAASAPAGSNGLLVLPYFAGERSPIFDGDARGTIMGLTLSHTRGDLFRAGYEGIAFGVRQILAFMSATAEEPHRLVAVGGGTQSRLWLQIVSDVTGRDQVVPQQRIGASYGDALMAAIGTGAVASSTDWAVAAETIHPDPAAAEVYGRLFDIYDGLYPATRAAMHELAAVQRMSGVPTQP